MARSKTTWAEVGELSVQASALERQAELALKQAEELERIFQVSGSELDRCRVAAVRGRASTLSAQLRAMSVHGEGGQRAAPLLAELESIELHSALADLQILEAQVSQEEATRALAAAENEPRDPVSPAARKRAAQTLEARAKAAREKADAAAEAALGNP